MFRLSRLVAKLLHNVYHTIHVSVMVQSWQIRVDIDSATCIGGNTISSWPVTPHFQVKSLAQSDEKKKID